MACSVNIAAFRIWMEWDRWLGCICSVLHLAVRLGEMDFQDQNVIAQGLRLTAYKVYERDLTIYFEAQVFYRSN